MSLVKSSRYQTAACPMMFIPMTHEYSGLVFLLPKSLCRVKEIQRVHHPERVALEWPQKTRKSEKIRRRAD